MGLIKVSAPSKAPTSQVRFELGTFETYAEIASVKTRHMDENAFEFLINELGPQFETLKPLARKLRDVLFPKRDNAVFTGTYAEPHRDLMYEGFIRAYIEAIGIFANQLKIKQEIRIYRELRVITMFILENHTYSLSALLEI